MEKIDEVLTALDPFISELTKDTKMDLRIHYSQPCTGTEFIVCL